MSDDEGELSNLDREALTRAIEIVSREPDRAGQLKKMLLDEPWAEVARFAAYSAQGRVLHLKPWQVPPCVVDEENPNERDVAAQALLRKMLAAGVSRYEPDPMTALAAAKRKPKAKAAKP